MSFRNARTSLLFPLVAALACDGTRPIAPDATRSPAPVAHDVAVRAISVTPGALALHPMWSDSLAVVLLDSAGNTLAGRTVRYASENPLVASVREGGVVTGEAAGTTAVQVTSEGVTVRVPVTVSAAPAASLALVASDSLLTEGQQRLFVATLRDAHGNPLGDRPFTWSTSDAGIASLAPLRGMSPAATVSAVRAGAATVSVRAEGLLATAAVRVRPRVARVAIAPDGATLHIGDEVQLAATLYDGAGNVLTDRSPMWIASSGAVALVSQSGLVRATMDGTTRVVAWAEGVADTVEVTVLKPVYFVDVTPRSVTMSVGTTLPLEVTLKDNGGHVLTGRTIVYWSANPGVATVSGAGVVTAVARGVTMISVSSEGRTTQAQVTVR